MAALKAGTGQRCGVVELWVSGSGTADPENFDLVDVSDEWSSGFGSPVHTSVMYWDVHFFPIFDFKKFATQKQHNTLNPKS